MRTSVHILLRDTWLFNLKLTVMGEAGEEEEEGGVDFTFPSGNSFPEEFDGGDVLQLPDPVLRRSPRMEGGIFKL